MNDWINPIGMSIDEDIAQSMRDPEFRAAWNEGGVREHIAGTVIIARTRLGWSQSRLAREIGTTQSVISRLEQGNHACSVRTLRRLANALHVSFTIDPDPPA